jgi:hypothetical protein
LYFTFDIYRLNGKRTSDFFKILSVHIAEDVNRVGR